MDRKNLHVFHILHIEHVNVAGEVLWENDQPLHNVLHDEGERAILSAYFATAMSGYGAPPANLYLGLDARASVGETDTLATLSGEPTGTGYARQAIATNGTGVAGQDFVLAQPGAYYQAQSKVVTFTAGAAWTAVTRAFLCTVLSGTVGKLICTVDLSQSRTLASGDKLNVSIYVGLSE